MPYDQKLADRMRDALSATQNDIEEKSMFQGMCFMVNGKMCVCVRDDEMMCRIGPEKYHEALELNGVRPMIHGNRVMSGYVFISPKGYNDKKEFDHWIGLCLEFNKVAKASKRRNR